MISDWSRNCLALKDFITRIILAHLLKRCQLAYYHIGTLAYLPIVSPLQLIERHPGTDQGIRLYLKRDDLLGAHGAVMASSELSADLQRFVQGNKWRKLEPILQQVLAGQYEGILTYGGPFSNHLHATAAAGRLFGIPTAAIVRGLTLHENNPTLQFVRATGMQLHPVTKRDYDQKTHSPAVAAIRDLYPAYFHLPEGGSTPESAQNCQYIAHEILAQLKTVETSQGNQLFVAVPAGTACTAAGLIAGLAGKIPVLVFPAAPSGVDASTLGAFGPDGETPAPAPFQIVKEYIFGGFAVFRPELLTFARTFREQTGILLDPLYTVKMMYGLFDMIQGGSFPENSAIVAVHTGGLQGWEGFRQRFGYNESWCAYTGLPS